jgi:LPXTG-motif cell wall-anchored protein
VKKKNLTRSTVVIFLLASAGAVADQQYPAADFQPEVLYQDSDYIAKNSSSNTSSSVKSKSTSNVSVENEVDSKYPAANFQPEVLYHDPNYKPSASSKEKSETTKLASTKQEVDSNTSEITGEAATSTENSSLSTYVVGLVALALAGFFFFRKSNSTTSVEKKSTVTTTAKKSYALNTGVAKYLNKVSGTGVSRYLDKKVKSATAATGVAKYLANQTSSTKSTAAKAATGVEKYMRDRS